MPFVALQSSPMLEWMRETPPLAKPTKDRGRMSTKAGDWSMKYQIALTLARGAWYEWLELSP
jgi:hypothetical protein